MNFEFSPQKMIVVDLYSGRYVLNNEGHEKFNLERNLIDGKYYGYFPATGRVNIQKLGAKAQDKSIDDILVVYVKKRENSSDREIIAFIPKGKVFADPQIDETLNRKLKNSYTKYTKLFDDIIQYIGNILSMPEAKNKYQDDVQNAIVASSIEIQNAVNRPIEITISSEGKKIKKNPSLAKTVLEQARYCCAINAGHTTFISSKGVQYMEGHHLIPCTVENAEEIDKKYQKNIDCCENIVCLCPTCHRAIHFGDDKTKREKIRFLYRQQGQKLKKVGINITEQELLDLYNCSE